MANLAQMIRTHPRKPGVDADAWERLVETLQDCARTCNACADACLGEAEVASLTRCIRLNLDCADVCEATARLMSRWTETDDDVLRAQLETCVVACRACGEECSRHADHMEHCRVCAEACRACEEACDRQLSALRA